MDTVNEIKDIISRYEDGLITEQEAMSLVADVAALRWSALNGEVQNEVT